VTLADCLCTDFNIEFTSFSFVFTIIKHVEIPTGNFKSLFRWKVMDRWTTFYWGAGLGRLAILMLLSGGTPWTSVDKGGHYSTDSSISCTAVYCSQRLHNYYQRWLLMYTVTDKQAFYGHGFPFSLFHIFVCIDIAVQYETYLFIWALA
jgi:hypothetical protein